LDVKVLRVTLPIKVRRKNLAQIPRWNKIGFFKRIIAWRVISSGSCIGQVANLPDGAARINCVQDEAGI
jgi:hypothetical protein